MNELLKWHVIYTHAGCEKRVNESLLKQNIESYCPVKYATKSTYWSNELVETPLFPCHVFARLKQSQYTQVLHTYGVSNFLYWLDRPAIIKNEEIDLIRRYTLVYRSLDVEKTCVNPNGQAMVFEDAFITTNENIIELNNTCTKVNLPSLGYTIIVVNQSNVQVVSTTAKRRFFWQLERKQAS